MKLLEQKNNLTQWKAQSSGNVRLFTTKKFVSLTVDMKSAVTGLAVVVVAKLACRDTVLKGIMAALC